jgi:hypothetical protein
MFEEVTMATRTKQGFHVPFENYDKDGELPSGVYIEMGNYREIWLHYAGVKDPAATTFSLPGDVIFLRDLSRTIGQVADYVDDCRHGRQPTTYNSN